MKIIEINSASQISKFIKFSRKIYKNNPNWVQPLIADLKFILNKSPFWEHAKRQLFMVFDDRGVPLGRIAAIIDYNYISTHKTQTGFFGFFESIDDKEVSKLLFDIATNWLKENGMSEMIGPMNPSSNDECGFLCEGFDGRPCLMMPYNPTYYLEHADAYGLNKRKQLYAYDMNFDSEKLISRLKNTSEMTLKRNPQVTIRTLNISDFENEIKKTIEIYNSAWEHNWGFVPWTEKEFYTIAKRMKSIFVEKLVCIASFNDRPIGMIIAIPDYNQITNQMNGRILPFGILKFLRDKKKIRKGRVLIMGVISEFRNKGIEGALYYTALNNARTLGYTGCEMSWILDDNTMMNRSAEKLGGDLYRKYQLFDYPLNT